VLKLKRPHEDGAAAAEKINTQALSRSLLLDVPGLAELLSVSTRTAKRILARRCLPVIKIGRRTLVRRTDAERWVERGCPVGRRPR
jgi:excisionase family DNA binding protein